MNKYDVQFSNECYVIGCLIKEPSLLAECKLHENHFYNFNNKMIFRRLNEMLENGEHIDLVTIKQSNQENIFKMGGSQHLTECYKQAISLHSFKSYETLVMQFVAIEESLQVVEDYKNQTNEVHRIKDFNQFVEKLQAIDPHVGKTELSTIKKFAKRVEEHEKSPKVGLSGIDTGFENINDTTDGWQLKDLIVLGARPSMGKTALALNMMINGIKNDDDVYGTFISAEMSEEAVIDRILALESGLPVMKMRNPNKFFFDNDWDLYRKGIVKVEQIKNKFSIFSDKNVRDIRTKVRRLTTDYPNKKHVIYIDHLSHLRIDGNYFSKVLEVGAIVQELKDIAKDYNASIVLLCQLSRKVEDSADKKPSMQHLRDSGEIEQIADVIMFIFREDYYKKNDPRHTPNGITQLFVEKERQGALSTIELKFNASKNCFTDKF